VLEYEPQNETVLSFIPLLNEKLKILQEEHTLTINSTVSGDSTSSGDDNANTDIPGDIDVSSSSDEDAINEGDTSSEISPYSSGSVSILSSDCDASDAGSDSEGEDYLQILLPIFLFSGESDEDCSESIESNATRSPSLNRSHSSNPDSSRHDVNSNSLDRSNSSKEVQSSSTSNSSKDAQSNSRSSSDVYFSLDSSSNIPNKNRDLDKSTSSSSSTRLGKETINRTLAKTIENIRKKYGIRRANMTMGSLKNINDLYCAGRN
ncbi:hypothetical protein WDU94_007231, partial [Cyamophila willieti]